ncbi:hypothetical protein E4U27_007035 [Claviceps purpurea]|nr:hypothetical protein E4U27_007035 [Claviceps purpurea]
METPSTPQQSDDFLYGVYEYECEEQTRYKQFGLHPIILGDVLPKPLTCVSDVNKEPRYRIMLKLGSGAFATVWLARDLVDKRYVAVKVGHGSDNPLPDREGEILSQIRETGPGKHGYERVIQLLDVFIVEGPNGFHQCLVTEVVSPLSDEDAARHCSFDIVRQIVEGFAFLHGEGIVHGDPHSANLGIALPQLEQFEEDDIIEFFGTPEIVPVVHWDPNFPLNSMPPYLVRSVSIGYFLQTRKAFPAGSITAKILDFGRAYRMSQVTPNLLGAAPRMIRPPEDLLHELCHGSTGSTWSEAADIWAVGCTQTECIMNNVSNLIAVKAGLGVTACTASKAGVVAFSRALCLEMAARSVRVNALLPGWVESAMWNRRRKQMWREPGKYWKTPSLIDLLSLLDLKPELKEAYLGDLGGMPSNRVARLAEVADAAVFLATNEYANNCVLNLDGGLSAA